MLESGVPGWIKRVLTVLAVIAAGWAFLLALLWFGQHRLIYLPDRNLPDPPAHVSVAETVTDDDVPHRMWVVRAEGEPIARVVVFNGNAGNRFHRLPLAESLAEEGMEVVLFDYRGYGDTEGRPTESALRLDAAAVAAASATDLPLVYLGESLGAAVATALAAERPPEALVLRSPFTSLADVAAVHYPLGPIRLLVRDRFDVEEAIGGVDVPVLVILGTGDSIIPPRLSRRVFEAAAEPKEMVEMDGFGHNDPGLGSGRDLAEAVRSFLEARLDRSP